MTQDITIVKGITSKPAAILIHGLGMDKRIWETPGEARILGGRFPLNILVCRAPAPEVSSARKPAKLSLGNPPEKLSTIFHDLKNEGHTVISYSQQRPSVETEVAVSELRDLINRHNDYFKAGIILIGHSRGGLIARKYLASADKRIKAQITLATPHKGSGMAQWAVHMAPLLSHLGPLLPEAERGTLTHTLKKIYEFLSGKAVKQLLPDSKFFKSFEDLKSQGVYSMSIGGNAPALFTIYRRYCEEKQERGRRTFICRYEKVFSIPELLEKSIPEKFFPEEMKKGRGDCLVSAESARLPYADAHYDFDVNHAGIIFDARVRAKIMEAVRNVL